MLCTLISRCLWDLEVSSSPFIYVWTSEEGFELEIKFWFVFRVWKSLCMESIEWKEKRLWDCSWKSFSILKRGGGDGVHKGHWERKPEGENEHLEGECNVLVMKGRETFQKAGARELFIVAKISGKINMEKNTFHSGVSISKQILIIHGSHACEFTCSLQFISNRPDQYLQHVYCRLWICTELQKNGLSYHACSQLRLNRVTFCFFCFSSHILNVSLSQFI